jgi:ribosome-binding protein aMBF1 (putative translation factor)
MERATLMGRGGGARRGYFRAFPHCEYCKEFRGRTTRATTVEICGGNLRSLCRECDEALDRAATESPSPSHARQAEREQQAKAAAQTRRLRLFEIKLGMKPMSLS